MTSGLATCPWKPARHNDFQNIGGIRMPNAILAPASLERNPQKHPWETPARLARGPGDGDWRRLYPTPPPRGLVNSAGK